MGGAVRLIVTRAEGKGWGPWAEDGCGKQVGLRLTILMCGFLGMFVWRCGCCKSAKVGQGRRRK